MSQFAAEDSQGSIDLVSNGDITLEADRNQDGAGDLVFRTAGVERARIKSNGTGTGWANVLGGSISANGGSSLPFYYNLNAKGGANGPSIGIGTTFPDIDFSVAGEGNLAVGGGWRSDIPAAGQRGNLGSLTTGYNNTAVGMGDLLQVTTGHDNIALGADIMASLIDGAENIGIGGQALHDIAHGTDNVAIGGTSLNKKASGSYSVAIGSNTLKSYLGDGCIAIGFNALSSLVGVQGASSHDTIIGYNAGLNLTGSFNVALGEGAVQGGTAGATNVNNNTGLGYNALTAVTTGNANTVVGYLAGSAVTQGGGNVIVGQMAGLAIVTLNNNTIVGQNAGTGGSNADKSGMVLVGSATVGGGTNAMALGRNASATNNGSVAIGCDSSGGGAATAVANQIAIGTASHHILLKTAADPGASAVGTSQFTLWLDPTAGAAKLMIRAKNASGTDVTGSVTLA